MGARRKGPGSEQPLQKDHDPSPASMPLIHHVVGTRPSALVSLGEHSGPKLHHKPLRIILSQKKKKAESFIKHRACAATET